MSNKMEDKSMTATAKRALVPKLRFPEFRDAGEWGSHYGRDLFGQVNDRNPDPNLPILAITQENGAIPRDAINYHVSVTEKSIESYKEVQVGDFIISLRSFQGGIEYSQYHGICSPAYVILRRLVRGEDLYFKQYFKTERFIRLLTKNLEGLRDGKMISYKQFSELQVPAPTPTEQEKIADCLSSIDELITLEAQKLDTLKTHKKGLMQQLFPAEGETQPKLRFPEFRDAGEWSETTLGQVVDIRSGYSPSKYNLSGEAQYPFLKVEDLNNCEKYQTSSREYSDDSLGVVPSGSIIFPKRGAAILNNKVRLNTVEVLMDTNLMAITSRRGVLAEFLYCIVVTEGLSKIADTSTIPQINNKHITPYMIRIPDKEEQQAIADFLSSLDALIAAQTEKLDALKSHKKGLMQQLFPVLDEVQG